ncbi:MAG: universal stress protein [Pyrinomonadaceae bacterium]|nr:universal stress protein [Pyrinomonadaceae bacterium]
MRIQRILCPTDFSAKSDEALQYAVALARAYEAKLFVFHCLRPSGTESNGETERERADARDRIRKHFENSVAASLNPAGLSKLKWEGIVVEGENPGDEIAHEATKHNVDLIVMRSRRRPHRAALLGSTAEQICRTATCPVLVTHSDERDWVDNRSDIELKRVLVAYDFSDYSELAVNYALSFAQEYQAELHLLHVLPPFTLNEPEISWYPLGQEGAYHTAAARLQKAVPAEAHLWCNVRHAVSEGHPYREILTYAENNQIDLICIGAHGAGFGMRALFGSNVDRVLRQAPCPVFVARPFKPVSGSVSAQSEKSTRAIHLPNPPPAP